MKIEIIVTEDGVFVPKGPLHELVPDEAVGRTLRAMASGAEPPKVKRTRGKNKAKRVALGKGIPEQAQP